LLPHTPPLPPHPQPWKVSSDPSAPPARPPMTDDTASKEGVYLHHPTLPNHAFPS
jgi:hypothetical protein